MSGTQTIWVVIGTTGEYSDRSEWLTKAFRSEESAKDYVLFLTKERQKLGTRSWNYEEREKVGKVMKAFDHNYSEDYSGTEWYVSSVELA